MVAVPKWQSAMSSKSLQDHADLECLVALYDYNGPACLEALAEVRKLGEIKIVAFDENEPTLKGIEDGNIIGTVVQDPFRYGYEAVRLLAQMHNDKTMLSVPSKGIGTILIRCAIVDRDNLDKFRHQLASELGSKP